MQDIGNLALILVTTLVLAHLSRLLNMPAVIGELLAGILIGPALLGWLAPSHTVSLFAEIGVIILMFLAGLESDLDLLKKYFKPGMLVAMIGGCCVRFWTQLGLQHDKQSILRHYLCRYFCFDLC